jgi:quinohemoprotein ethanol dehydrogenase
MPIKLETAQRIRAGITGGLLVSILTLLTSCIDRSERPVAAADDAGAANGAGAWLVNGRDYLQQRHAPLSQISRENLDKLGLAWEFHDFVVRGRTHHAMESNPIVVDGVMFVSGPWGVAYALDARTGKSLWTFDPRPDGNYGRSACCDVVNRGLAFADGKVFVGALDGYLYAIDAKTGKQVWKVDTLIDRQFTYTITSAPLIAEGKVIIGNAGGDMNSRGYVSAYDINTSALAWRFYAVPGDPKKGPDENADVTFARKTWAADTRWDLGGGGNAWDSLAFDPELKLVYLALGNGSPHPRWQRSPGGGDNLFIASIVAVDVTTGRLKWFYQQTPGDSWDYASTAHLMLADLEWEGRQRKVIMQAPKNGMFYVLDRQSGELLRADAFTTVNWNKGVDLKTGRPQFTANGDYSKQPRIIWPSAAGGHGWQPMSFNPATGLVYFHVYDAPMKYVNVPVEKFNNGVMNMGSAGQFPPFTTPADLHELKGQPEAKFEARLKAWNPKTGAVAWASEPLPFVSGGTLTTGVDLVFQGSTDGTLTVYDAANGKVLRKINTGTAIQAAPISYELDGVQYIAVTAGAGGPQGAAFAPDVAAATYQNYERLLVFRLGGVAVPLPGPAVRPERQPVPARVPATRATLRQGEGLFRLHCQRCHLVGGAYGLYPDLWNMSAATLANFSSIVYDGAFVEGGMAAFSAELSRQDVQAISSFIVNDWNDRTDSQRNVADKSPRTFH